MVISQQQTELLDKLCRFLSSVRGTDKVLMLYAYMSKIVIARLRARDAGSMLATRLQNLATPVSDTRILLRYYGLIPLFQWILFSERNPPPTPFLRIIYRLQNMSNLFYYPLEHLYYLGAHKVVPMSDETLNRVGLWSCRFWAAYVVLYFLQLYQEHRLLELRQLRLTQRSRSNAESKDVIRAEQRSIASDMHSLLINTIINAAYFPLTMHWSIEGSTFPDFGVGICGSVAAVAQIYSAWKSA
ncbi:peroxisomal biogenesis factor 11 [Chytriomyces sp. MP71]|nr:peroxisomal biogenesis factor 11 [Chytriomyces sp. MP71]